MTAVKSPTTGEALTRQALGARTLPDIEAAARSLREWIAAHPEDEGMRDGFEQLSHMEDIARERAALPPEQVEWYHQHDCLMRQAQDAVTLPEVAVAMERLDTWLMTYPDDETMRAMREQLEIMQELLGDTATMETRPLQAAV